MWWLLLLSVIQRVLLALGQVVLKIALQIMPPFGWNSKFWLSLLTNWQFALSGIIFGSASILWMYILKHYPLSMAAPLVSMSYVITTLMAIIVFHETVPWERWLGTGLILCGVILVVSKY